VRSHSFATIPTSSLRSVIRFSRPLDVFLRTRACRLIPSRCRVQDSFPFRGFSPRAAALPLRKALPPCRRSSSRSPACAGCHTTRTSASRSSSARGRVLCRTVIHSAASRSPPRVPLPQALRTSFGWTRFTRVLRSRPSFVPPSLFAIAVRLGPQRLPREARRRVSASPGLLELSSLSSNPPCSRPRLTARCLAVTRLGKIDHLSPGCPHDRLSFFLSRSFCSPVALRAQRVSPASST
jgi:hypothetical protein